MYVYYTISTHNSNFGGGDSRNGKVSYQANLNSHRWKTISPTIGSAELIMLGVLRHNSVELLSLGRITEIFKHIGSKYTYNYNSKWNAA